MMQQTPAPDEIREQRERLFRSTRFRGVKLRRLLAFLIEEYLAGRAGKLTELYIGESLKDEELRFDENSNRWGYRKTRANLSHVRNRLRAYYEKEGYRDPIIIKLNPGSYAPVIAYNPVSSAMPDLDPAIARLILRAKTAIDLRTMRGAWRALNYCHQIPATADNSRQLANSLFIPMAVASIMPGTVMAIREVTDPALAHIKRSGVAPWESIFVAACAEACYRHEWRKAHDLFELANTQSHGEARYFWWYTALLAGQGRINEAIDILDAAVRHFSRTNIAARTDLALLLVMNGQFADAEEHLCSCLEFAAADNPLLVFHLALLFEGQDKLIDALTPVMKLLHEKPLLLDSLPVEEALEKRDTHGLLCGLYALLVGRIGAKEPAAQMLDILLDCKAKRPATSCLELALACIGAEKFDDAVSWLRRAAFEQSDPMAMWFHRFPPLRHLRAQSSFKALLSELHLPQ